MNYVLVIEKKNDNGIMEAILLLWLDWNLWMQKKKSLYISNGFVMNEP